MPSLFQGVMFRNQGDPVQDLSNAPGVTAEMRHYGLAALRDQHVGAVQRGRPRIVGMRADPLRQRRDQRQPEQQVEVRPQHQPVDLLRDLEQVVVIIVVTIKVVVEVVVDIKVHVVVVVVEVNKVVNLVKDDNN